MKNLSKIKIFSLSLTLLLFPFISSAQNFSEQIQDVQWNLTPGIFSVTGNGSMTTNVPDPSFRWQIEVGYAGEVTTNPNGSLNVSGDVFGYVPADTSNLFASSAPDLIPAGPNQFSFNMASNFQNTLWPATRYYFDIVEWHENEQNANPVRDYVIMQTDQVEDLNLNIDQQSNGNVIMTVTLPSSVNAFNPVGGVAIQGMPVAAYILTEERPGQGMEGNDCLVVWPGTAVFNSTGSATFTVPVGTNLDPDAFYYVKIINDQPGAGQLPILFEDLPFLLSNSEDGNQSSGGSTNPGFPDSGEEFDQGLITCDGLETECTFEKLLLMVNKVIRFLIFVIGVPIVTLMFAYAGFVLLTSGGNPSKKDEAKSLILNATIGLIILLAAWLIVRTVLVIFGYTGPLLGIMGA